MATIRRLLLGIGAMKAGTTWLYRQLEQHPDICFSPEKELHFLAFKDGNAKALGFGHRYSRFRNALGRAAGELGALGPQGIAWYLDYLLCPRTWSWYARRFPGLEEGQYAADFSNLSATLTAARWAQIQDSVDELRLIYVLRNPLDRIWSQMRFHYQLAGKVESALCETPGSALVAEARKHSSFGSNLETIYSVIPRQQVLVLIFDHIHRDPVHALETIEDFLGIPKHDYLQEKLHRKINAVEEVEMPAWLIRELGPQCDEELDKLGRLGIEAPENWYNRR